ncbi:NAD(P)-binding protein [Yoonia sp. SS1-5]|uniref:NAD(P)-binding protein n=1 Tax=Yoonia rhodophyticola TaxID=3137370 RepID=A0AAN0MDW2_9RHOB
MSVKKKRIAVIGGGVGAITATYAITMQPNWQDEYDITLYQLGWRLGGKGASGRNMKKGGRIEEHGLHIWAGFYENGFRLMRDCYEQLNVTGLRSPDAPLGTLEKAFTGLNSFLLAEEIETDGKKELHPWRIEFFGNDDKPGSGGVLPTPYAYFQEVLKFIASLLDNMLDEVDLTADHALPPRFHVPFKSLGLPIKKRSPVHHMRDYAAKLPQNAFDHTHSQLMTLGDMARHTQIWFDENVQKSDLKSDESRRLHYLVSLSLAFFRGTIDNGVFRHGFDAIDDAEISQWLLDYGASKEAVYSAVFRGCYDYVFGYPAGVTDHRSVGAGTAIRGLLRLAFTYKGSLFFKMMAGMGDTIFGPYYQILKHRGVKFKYFNAATHLGLDETKTYIDRIDMVEQAEVLEGEYDPLVPVKDLPCWPSEPIWEQLKDGERLAHEGVDFECEKEAPKGRAYTLRRGEDYDEVILGASLGSLPYMAQELIDASDRWRMMMEKVPTVATHAAQFWMDRTAKEMGWNDLVAKHNVGEIPDDLRTVITSFEEPLDTWADMTDLIGREDWDTPGPTSIAYFCSPAHDAGIDKAPFPDLVKDWADNWLVQMWPDAVKDGKFDMSLLHAQGTNSDHEKFAYQYFRQNFYGSERYVLSVPGSVQYRLPPDGAGFQNLFLAGDWTRCGINAGCVEAATISGLGAARALTGADIEIVGEGDIAPDAGPSDRAKLASPYAQSADWPLTPFFGVGKLDGFFSFHAVDSKELEKCLPAGMTLHPQTITPAGTHPVSILANQQMGVRPSILPQLMGFKDYYEAIIAINYVQVEGQEGAFAYLPNLYLNSRMPQLAGVWFYGYNKRLGKLSMANDRYRVANSDGTPVWSGQYAQRDFARPLTDYETFGAVHRLADQVVVTKNKLGKWQYSNLDFGLGAAYGAGIHAEIDVHDAGLANLPAGKIIAQPLKLENPQASKNLALPGAFRIWSSWTLSNPFDSGRIARLEAEKTRL